MACARAAMRQSAAALRQLQAQHARLRCGHDCGMVSERK
jgi:hypothetical protein